MKNKNNNVAVPVSIGCFVNMDFGEFSNAIEFLLEYGMDRYLSNNRFEKYKTIQSILELKNESINFWTIFKTLLEKNFNYNIELDNFYKSTMNISRIRKEDFNLLKEMMDKEIIYKYYVGKQFDLLCDNIYNKIINISLFEDLIDD